MKKFVIVLAVIVAVLVAADFSLAAAAEYQVSKKMRAQLSLADDPSVDIHGFPFITQALAGDYSDVQVNATGVPVKSTLRDLEVDADLRHVRVSLSDLLSGHASAIAIDEVDGQVKLKASDISRLLDIPDLTITPQSLDMINGIGADEAQQRLRQQTGQDYLTAAGVQLSGTIDILGKRTKVSAFGVISVTDGTITVTPKKIQLDNGAVPDALVSALERQLLPRFALTLNPDVLPLPFSVRATGVQVDPGALVVRGTAHHVVVSNGNVSS